MQASARADLERLFRREMAAAGIEPGRTTIWSTPRRLALIAYGLPQATRSRVEETKGPPVGAPDAAVEGFCRKAGVAREALKQREVKGRATWFALAETPGRAMRDVLADAILAIIRDFSWPKSMRWGESSISTQSMRWVRPLSGIVAILGEELVECEIATVRSAATTTGHRFHHPGAITIGGAHDYAARLRACHVIVDHAEREALIRDGARAAVQGAGLTLVEDEGLVAENAGLTEWPVPLLGRFDEALLEVPPEVIRLTARVNQKYFVCERTDGTLANAFVCTANIEPTDGGAGIIEGNRKVLAARLADARFFWQQDRRKTLEQHAEGLERITFHEKVGTMADKVERVAKLARWLVEEGIVGSNPTRGATTVSPDLIRGPASSKMTLKGSGTPASAGVTREELANLAEQAARLAKADLVTEMVGEFPELQGVMGGYYARAEGLPDAVADAIRYHYKPVGQGDEVPTAPVTLAVSLADKLDTLVGFYLINEKPTGSKDPFALRRAAIGLLDLLVSNAVRLELPEAIARALYGHTGRMLSSDSPEAEYNRHIAGQHGVFNSLPIFLAERLKVQQREAGVRHDLIDAVFALGNEDDLVRLLARVKALQNFVETEDGANLLAAYKRAANILKKEDWHGARGEIARTGEEDPLALVDDPDLGPALRARMAEKQAANYEREPAELALEDALDKAEPEAAAAVAAEEFEAAMEALANLRGPIDRFFDEVTVNDDDADKRRARLEMLARFRDAVHQVADFSQIEG